MSRFRTTLPWAVVAALGLTCLVSFTVVTLDPADQGTPVPRPAAVATGVPPTAAPSADPSGTPASPTASPTESDGPSPAPATGATASPGRSRTPATVKTVIPTSPSPDPTRPGTTAAPGPTASRAAPYCLPLPSVVSLKVLTFNIHAGIGPRGLDLDTIAGEIRASGADVVLLQEVDRFRPRSGSRDTPAQLATELGMYQAFAPNLTWAAGSREPQQYGLATLSRFPITEAEHHTLPNRPGGEQRGLLRTRVDVQGHSVDVYNTHLDHTSTELRRAQARSVQQVVSTSAPTPVVVGGDFNATPDSEPYRTMTATLTDPWTVVGQGSGLTVPPRAPRARIDHIYVSKDLVPSAARVLPSAVSDHRAVGVDLLLPTADRCERSAGPL
ncbi:endonuclease/exonuclease/phosphatase family protein [Nocardioides houyundeii]|uniref:endonuclease/exonuclease/phosphatase family protein n=1 Tax=Nocardioides houyundeii TaxID=2045452 RepID=UPI001315880D|nr:endonuclease/exonuclease/phosphatase family protein [Nocardioides houyundeii]